jgi:hypothetical protein
MRAHADRAAVVERRGPGVGDDGGHAEQAEGAVECALDRALVVDQHVAAGGRDQVADRQGPREHEGSRGIRIDRAQVGERDAVAAQGHRRAAGQVLMVAPDCTVTMRSFAGLRNCSGSAAAGRHAGATHRAPSPGAAGVQAAAASPL